MTPGTRDETQIPVERDLDEDLGVGSSNLPPPTNLFPDYTPASIARQMVGLAHLESGMSLLEPSAGSGVIASIAAQHGAVVTCVELNQPNIEKLMDGAYATLHADFLNLDPRRLGLFDRVVMNPPRNAVTHIQHAIKFLKPNGILVALHRLDTANIAELQITTSYPLPEKTFSQNGQAILAQIIVIQP